MGYVIFLAAVAALGGLLFGYDTAVVNGAIEYLQMHFELGAGLKGWAASSALIGCIPGAAFAGVLGDRFGRKKVLLLCALLFAISAIGSGIPFTLNQFVIARFIGGLAVGAASMLAPMYIAEVAPERMRGRLVTLYQLAIVSGILIVFFVNRWVQTLGDDVWNIAYGWRWMFASETLPAVIFGILLFFIPESPRWLAKVSRKKEAFEIFSKISGNIAAETEMKQIEESLAHEEGKFSELFTSGYRMAMIIGVCLAVFQQFSGINAIMYYSTSIIASIGTSMNAAFTQTVIIGIMNLLFTMIALWLIDKAGRKWLLLVGTAVQTFALLAVGILFKVEGHPMLLLFFILLYVAAFSLAMGPVVWTVMSEIFPNKVRGKAMSVATLILWISCYIVSQTFPMLVEKAGNAATFWFYAVCSLLSFVFVALLVPETKGKTLEEIEQSWIVR